MKFTYRSGQKPLDGFTIKRGVGHGGFGEVYLALSDGGKEVALKLIRGHTDIELRGIAQCLNFKHPHLVHLYDLRTDAKGDHWVVMEYVLGESLGQVLNRHPIGLPVDLAREWFLALAKAVAYLHDHGVVHRDLKPGNLFIENGVLKVGDYGLCKSISSSQHNAQTQNVGTVFYMAPEIGKGNYNQQIDIYAAGVILYEMLTGRVPFSGETIQEVMLKHLTDTPDLQGLPPRYASIIAKALDKNPARRYASITDMAREVESIARDHSAYLSTRPGTPNVEDSGRLLVSKATNTPIGNSPSSPSSGAAEQASLSSILANPIATTSRERWRDGSRSLALSALLAIPSAALWAVYARSFDWVGMARLGLLTIGLSWTVLLTAHCWPGRTVRESLLRRLGLFAGGVLVGLSAFWLDGWMLPIPGDSAIQPPASVETLFGGEYWMQRGALRTLGGYAAYFALALSFVRWWRLTERQREERFTLFPVVVAGFWGSLLLFLWPWQSAPQPLGILALMTMAGIVQSVSPWTPPGPPTPKRLRLRSTVTV